MADRTVYEVIAKAATADVDAASELWRISLYEALADLTDTYAPMIDRDIAKAAVPRIDAARRALVRSYIAKRLDGEDPADLVAAAARLVLLETFSKDETPDERREASAKQPRDHGRFASAHGAIDRVRAFTAPGAGEESNLSATVRESAPKDRRVYRQLGMVGQALSSVGAATAQPHAALLGNAASLVGELGNEAERVLSPSIRRTAYRYRGTERRPNRQLQLASQRLNGQLDQVATLERSNPEQALALREQLAEKLTGQSTTDDQAAISYTLTRNGASQLTGDQIRLQSQSDLATLSLVKRIPDLDSARISLAAGQLPPSVGMIIDADGDLVSEAQGFNGDHYLPFDLKNLKRLHGGAYTRTRASGGPTDEDVYTGLLTGARQVQVVSNSGVFRIEFDPDVRGGRRYSDKARRMVQRYSRLLAAVGSGELYARDLSSADEAKIRQETYNDPNLSHLDATELKNRATKAVDDQRALRTVRSQTDDELLEQAESQAREETAGRAGSGASFARRRKEIYDNLRTKADESRLRTHRLDGEGYYTAMQALAQEFPYYIRDVNYVDLPTWLADHKRTSDRRDFRGTDIGRTTYRSLEPKGRKTLGWDEPAGAAPAATTAAPAAADADTPAAAAATAAGELPGWLDPKTLPLTELLNDPRSRLTRNLGGDVKRVTALAHMDGNDMVKDLFDRLDLSDEEIDGSKSTNPSYLGMWATSERDPGAIGKWLLASPRHFDTLSDLLKEIKARGVGQDTLDRLGVPQLDEKIDALKLVAGGGTKPDGDPVLTVPVNGQPVAFSDVQVLGDRMVNYTEYLRRNPETAAAVSEIRSVDPEQTAELIGHEVDRYQQLAEWAADPGRGKEPGSDDERREAQAIGELGSRSKTYVDLETLQRAFAFTSQARAVAALTGQELAEPPQEREEAPKVPPPAPAGTEETAKRHSPRPRIVVHPPGSALSVAMAKNNRR